MSNDEYKWLTTLDSPFVILPASEVKNWSGAFSVKSIEAQKIVQVPEDDFLNPAATDYGKACQITEAIGTFDFGSGRAIVLSDYDFTTCKQISDQEVLIVRQIYVVNDELVDDFVRSDEIAAGKNWTFNELINLKGEDYIMFDTVECGFEINEEDVLHFKLAPGEYQIKTCEFWPDSDTQLLLHKFEKI